MKTVKVFSITERGFITAKCYLVFEHHKLPYKFAVTNELSPDGTNFDARTYVVTHLATGMLVPGSESTTIGGAVLAGLHKIEGKSLDEWATVVMLGKRHIKECEESS